MLLGINKSFQGFLRAKYCYLHRHMNSSCKMHQNHMNQKRIFNIKRREKKKLK